MCSSNLCTSTKETGSASWVLHQGEMPPTGTSHSPQRTRSYSNISKCPLNVQKHSPARSGHKPVLTTSFIQHIQHQLNWQAAAFFDPIREFCSLIPPESNQQTEGKIKIKNSSRGNHKELNILTVKDLTEPVEWSSDANAILCCNTGWNIWRWRKVLNTEVNTLWRGHVSLKAYTTRKCDIWSQFLRRNHPYSLLPLILFRVITRKLCAWVVNSWWKRSYPGKAHTLLSAPINGKSDRTMTQCWISWIST